MRKKIWGGVLFVMLCVTLWLTFILPIQLANSAYKRASEAYTAVSNNVAEFQVQTESMKWFKKSYTDGIRTISGQAQKNLSEMKNDLATAEKAGAKDKKALSKMTEENLKNVAAIVKKGQTELVICQKMANDARSGLADLERTIALSRASMVKNSINILDTRGKYLSKYVLEITKQASLAQKRIEEADQLVSKADALLPPLNDKSGKGDPKAALLVISDGSVIAGESQKLVKNVSDELAFQEEALTKAESKVALAVNDLETVYNHLETIVQTTPLLPERALKEVYRKQEDANQLLEKVNKALNTEVEKGKYDKAFVYKQALLISSLSGEIIKETDQQVRWFNEASVLIAKIKSEIKEANVQIGNSLASETVLTSQHAPIAWKEVKDNVSLAKKTVKASEQALTGVELLFYDQAFSKSLENGKKAISELDNAKKLLSELQSYAQRLEDFRNNWPNEEKRTKDIIAEEDDYVSQYGAYSASAKNDFADAEKLFEDALEQAKGKLYAEAVGKAKKAYNLAEGTGDVAYNAYRENQRRLSDNDSSYGRDSEDESSGDDSGENSYSFPSDDGSSDDDSYGGGSSYDSGDSSYDYSSGSDGGGFSDYSGGDGGGFSDYGGGDGGGFSDDGGGDGGGFD